MGFFSWVCAVSGESIANTYSGQPSSQSDCYLVLPDKVIHEPFYGGYGEFGGHDVYELMGNGNRELGIDRDFERPEEKPFDIKVVLAEYYKGQSYDELSASEQCPNQGYFFDNDEEEEDEECYNCGNSWCDGECREYEDDSDYVDEE